MRRAAGAVVAMAISATVALADGGDPIPRLERLLEGLDATLVVYERGADRRTRIDPERAARRYSPCSTFKIPNSLIGLETGVIAGPDILVDYDEAEHPRPSGQSDRRHAVLAQPHTLRTALANSVVWYYQELAEQVGAKTMGEYLERFDYGNQDISAGIDVFWLSKTLRISADEQIGFLQKFYDGKLASDRSTEIVKEILVLEQNGDATLSAKTGSGWGDDGRPLGWWVGYVENGDDIAFFAFNLQADSWDELLANRVNRCRRALQILGLIGEESE